MSTYSEVREARLTDPGIYFWMRDLIRTLDDKDIVDVMHGLDDVRQLFARKYGEITGREWDAR